MSSNAATQGEKEFRGLPVSKIERYRKFVALFEHQGTSQPERLAAQKRMIRMEQQHPGIRDALDALLAFEDRVDEARMDRSDAVAGKRPFTQYDAMAMWQQFDAQNPATHFVDRMFRRGVDWAADQLRNATIDDEDGETTLATLEEQLSEQADVEIDEFEAEIDDDDGGTRTIEMISFTIEMPLDLWTRIATGQRLQTRFVRWLEAVGSDDETPLPPS
jgi:hypothetical protein